MLYAYFGPAADSWYKYIICEEKFTISFESFIIAGGYDIFKLSFLVWEPITESLRVVIKVKKIVLVC